MRILNLRFKNLNSLVGEWNIDFTHPVFQSEGIFAITGPTGAGKSTILDALCLGLFGRTPRLKEISKSSNEIMSRHTWECFSEVTFAVPIKTSGKVKNTIYKTHWYQHRAGKKETGSLQKHSFEIAEAETGSIITIKKKEVAKEVEHLTGMDFGRFTRSMMLAQGGFAAFLQAKGEERSPLLEQITGTEIYSKISCMVHEKTKSANSAVKEREQMMQGLFLLSEEELALLLHEKEEYQQKEQVLAGSLEKSRTLLAWLLGIKQLQEDTAALISKQKEVARQKEAFEKDAKRLALARKAQEFVVEYTGLMGLRKNQKEKQEHITVLSQVLPNFELAEGTALREKTSSLELLNKEREEQEKLASTIKNVRILDERIALQHKSFVVAQQELQALKEQNARLLEQKKVEQEKELFSKEQLILCQKNIEATQEDAKLVEHLSAIKATFLSLYAQEKNVNDISHEAIALEKKQKEAESFLTLCKKNLEEQNQHLALALNKHKKSSTMLHEIFQGETYEDVLAKKHTDDLYIKNLADMANILTSIMRLSKQQEELVSKEKLLLEEVATTTTHRNRAIEKRDTFIRERDLLEQQLLLLSRIASFEEERKKLQKDEACPLCGSVKHPFVTEEVLPEVNSSKERFTTAKADVEACEQEIKIFDQRLTANTIKLEHIHEDRVKIKNNIKELNSSLEPLFTLAGLPFTTQSVPEESFLFIQAEIAKTRVCLDTTIIALEKARGLREALEKEQKNIDILKERVTSFEKEGKAAEIECKHLQEVIAKTKKEHERQAEELRITILDIQEDMLAPYGIQTFLPFSKEKSEKIIAQLEFRKETWLKLQKDKEALTKAVDSYAQSLKNILEKLEESQKSLSIKSTQVDSFKKVLEIEQEKRYTLFGSLNPDEEEVNKKNRVAVAEASMKKKEYEYSVAAEKVRDTLRDKKAAEKKLKENILQCSEVELTFLRSIHEAGFINEDEYTTALLPIEVREELEEREEILTKHSIEISSLLQEKQELLEREQKKYTDVPGGISIEHINGELTQKDEALITLRKSLGSIEQRIIDNDTNKNLYRREQELLEKLRIEANRWSQLNDLIGSHDGKKFRNYAQGLTFELMVVHANVQLQKMNDRYILTRDKLKPLELNVIDTYQAGEERSTRNLSGGESFIISLALALGLSAMASGTMRVDSLFLDEGFGALDEETLETALDTLAGLRQEGKLIGLISHIGALKERIGLQLAVRPVRGGKSELSGAGITFLGM